MHRRGQSAAGDDRTLALAIEEGNRVEVADFVMDAQALQQVGEVGAAAHRAVLALIHPLAGLVVEERGGTSAQQGPLLEERDMEPGIGQGKRGGNARYAPTDDDNRLADRVHCEPNPQRLPELEAWNAGTEVQPAGKPGPRDNAQLFGRADAGAAAKDVVRSEEHTSELQSRGQLVCRLLLEQKNTIT